MYRPFYVLQTGGRGGIGRAGRRRRLEGWVKSKRGRRRRHFSHTVVGLFGWKLYTHNTTADGLPAYLGTFLLLTDKKVTFPSTLTLTLSLWRMNMRAIQSVGHVVHAFNSTDYPTAYTQTQTHTRTHTHRLKRGPRMPHSQHRHRY